MKLRKFLVGYMVFIFLLCIVCLVGSIYLLKMAQSATKNAEGKYSYTATTAEFNFMKATVILIGISQLIIAASISSTYRIYGLVMTVLVIGALVGMSYATFDATKNEKGEYIINSELSADNRLFFLAILLVVVYSFLTVALLSFMYGVITDQAPVGVLPITLEAGLLIGGTEDEKLAILYEKKEILTELISDQKS